MKATPSNSTTSSTVRSSAASSTSRRRKRPLDWRARLSGVARARLGNGPVIDRRRRAPKSYSRGREIEDIHDHRNPHQRQQQDELAHRPLSEAELVTETGH